LSAAAKAVPIVALCGVPETTVADAADAAETNSGAFAAVTEELPAIDAA
jgi:hypothetical protein